MTDDQRERIDEARAEFEDALNDVSLNENTRFELDFDVINSSTKDGIRHIHSVRVNSVSLVSPKREISPERMV